MKYVLLAFLFMAAVLDLKAQQTKSGYGFQSDSTASSYENQDALGGPKTIGAQLKVDNQKKESFFRVPIRVTKGWYAWKKRLNEQTGIQLGINYTSVFMRSFLFERSIAFDGSSSGIIFLTRSSWIGTLC